MTLSRKLLTSLAALSVGALCTPEAEASRAQMLQQAQRIAETLTPDRASAEDLVAETAMKLLQRRPGVLLEYGDDCGGYLRRSLVNCRRDQLRRHRVRPLALESDLSAEDGVPEPAAAHTDPFQAAAAQEFRDGLAPKDAQVLGLLETGLSERQIAEKLSCTRHFVRSSLGRIAELAREYFALEA